jgi:hypothetical protein
MIRTRIAHLALLGIVASSAATVAAGALAGAQSGPATVFGTGVYRQIDRASGRLLPDANRIDLTPAGAGRFRFVVQAVQRTHPGAGSVNIGEIDGTISSRFPAIFRSPHPDDAPCTLTFGFGARPDEIVVEQDASVGNCGFGNAVDASGRYRRTNERPVRDAPR